MKVSAFLGLAMFAGFAALGGCSSNPAPAATATAASGGDSAAVADATATFPPGREGKLLAYGKSILTNTPTVMKGYVTAGMSCEACHLNAGTKAHATSLIGAAARFPQWNKRSKRYIFLQDRLAECFLYSENGRPPAYNSREMIALAAYVTSLSNGAKIGSKGFPGQALIEFKPDHTADPHAGATVYTQKCLSCHGANGQGGGNGLFPPLWGAKSFNNGAGMHHLGTMAAFVRYNMPWNGPINVLSKQEAYDVAAYVLSHPRPVFDKTRLISFPAVEADKI